MSRAAAPSPASEAAPEEIPPVFGSILGGGGGGAAFAATGGAAFATGAGGGAIFGGGGGGGGGLQLPFAVTSPALASGHGPPLAVAPPALASGIGPPLALTSSVTVAVGGVCATAGMATIAAMTAIAATNKIVRLKYVTPFHLRNLTETFLFLLRQHLKPCSNTQRVSPTKTAIYRIFFTKHTALCVEAADTLSTGGAHALGFDFFHPLRRRSIFALHSPQRFKFREPTRTCAKGAGCLYSEYHGAVVTNSHSKQEGRRKMHTF